MSASTSVNSEPTAATKDPPQKKPGPGFSFERFAGWALPLITILLLLGALEEAVRAGQLKWAPAGVAVYLVSLAIWLVINLVDARRLSQVPLQAASAAPSPSAQVPATPPRPVSERQSGRFGAWLFPSLALVALVSASYMAAESGQEPWVISGAITCGGSFLIWAGWLLRPFGRKRTAAPTASPSSASASIRAIDYMISAGLLLLSAGAIGAAIAFARYGRQAWLILALACFVAYVVADIDRVIRTTTLDLTRKEVIKAVAVHLAIGGIAAALATAVWFHRLSWGAAAVIGVCACLAGWLRSIVRILPRTSPSDVLPDPARVQAMEYNKVPFVLAAGLLAFAGVAVYKGEIPALWGGALALLGGLALWFSWMFVVSVQVDGPPQIESNWAGLGGGIGGWRCSPSLIFAFCALTLAVFAGSALYQVSRDNHPAIAVDHAKPGSAAATAANSTRTEPLPKAQPSTPPNPEQH